jgi:hypothetical protein
LLVGTRHDVKPERWVGDTQHGQVQSAVLAMTLHDSLAAKVRIQGAASKIHRFGIHREVDVNWPEVLRKRGCGAIFGMSGHWPKAQWRQSFALTEQLEVGIGGLQGAGW